MTVPLPSDPRAPRAPGPDELRREVDAAVAALDELGPRPLAEHVVAFERVHAALGAALAQGSDPGPGRA